MPEQLNRHLETLFVLDAEGRILSTREPQAKPGQAFMLMRGTADCIWALGSDIPEAVAEELNRLAKEEPPLSDLHDAPRHAHRYQSLLGGQVSSGLAFTFPQAIPPPLDVVLVKDEKLLNHHFSGWMPGEINAGRAPVMAIMHHGYPVSVCFCARRSHVAAEAGVETAPGFRGLGLAARVAAAWALAVRSSGWVPLYSTDWSNTASIALAQKLGLEAYAVDWSISD